MKPNPLDVIREVLMARSQDVLRDKALAALDSLATNSKDLDPAIQAIVQENFWELAGKPKAVEPSEDATAKPRTNADNDAIKLIKSLERVQFTDYCNRQGIALITARDERIRRECADRWELEVYWGYTPDTASLPMLRSGMNDKQKKEVAMGRAAIMGRKE